MQAPPARCQAKSGLKGGGWATTNDRRDLIVISGLALEEHRHERPDVLEADPLVGPAGGRVEVVDVERDGRGHRGEALRHYRGHAGHREPLAAELRLDPDPLDLAGRRRDRADLGLEDDVIAVDP